MKKSSNFHLKRDQVGFSLEIPLGKKKTFAAEEKMKLDPKKVKVHPARKMKDVLDTWTVKKREEAEKNSRDSGTASRAGITTK